jgi:hypothetical protein
MNPNINSVTLRRAADLQDEIEAKQNELAQLLNGQTIVDASLTAPRINPAAPRVTIVQTASGRKFSPEAIEKIRAAQRRRWRKVRKDNKAAQVSAEATPAPVATPAPAPAPAPAVAVPAPVTHANSKTAKVAQVPVTA